MVELRKMEEVVIKEVDPQGRISIPVKWRKGWGTRRLVLIRREDRIEMFTLEPISPSGLFDSIRLSEAESRAMDFTDPHAIKRVLSETGTRKR